MRSALATAAERRVVCDSFAGKTTEVLDLHVAHHPHGALPLTPERHKNSVCHSTTFEMFIVYKSTYITYKSTYKYKDPDLVGFMGQ